MEETQTQSETRKIQLFSLCVCITVIIGWIRYLTGPDLALSLFYLLPILVGVWNLGRFAGILLSFISAASWLTADVLMLHAFSKPYIPFINETFRLVVFLIITYVADKLKIALEDQKAQARSDALTQVSNRRGFTELAIREIEKSRRHQTALSAIYMDIDDFKKINDKFGHAAGDRLLSLVGKELKNNVRATDVVARLGGDEFCILLGETKKDSAVIISQKLQRLLLDRTAKEGLPVTFSIGVATFESPPDGVNHMVNAADNLMYEAKKAGKNRVQSAVVRALPNQAQAVMSSSA